MSRVVHLRSGQGLYGAERALLVLARATEPPLEPVVVTLARPGRADPLGEAARDAGLPAVRVDATGRLSPAALGPLVQLARGGLLHAHDYKSLLLGLAAGAVTRIPVVATFHGDTGHLPRVRLYEALARRAARWAAAVATPSEPLAAQLRAASPRTPVHVVPNGIPLGPLPTAEARARARAALGFPECVPVVAFVGRLSVEKSPEVLLRAAAGLEHAVVLAGDGPLRAHLEVEARGRARFLGFVADVAPLLAAADVLALPSRTEGLPLAVLEAMAAGVPVVASAVGALPEVLEGGAGLLVPPGDVAALRAALVRLRDPGLRSALAAAGRARVEARHGAAAMARAYLERLYRPALERARGDAHAPQLQAR